MPRISKRIARIGSFDWKDSTAEGADNITWEDFDYLEHEDVGSGVLMNEYKLKDSYSLIMGGQGGEEIKNIYILLLLSEKKYTIKNGNKSI